MQNEKKQNQKRTEGLPRFAIKAGAVPFLLKKVITCRMRYVIAAALAAGIITARFAPAGAATICLIRENADLARPERDARCGSLTRSGRETPIKTPQNREKRTGNEVNCLIRWNYCTITQYFWIRAQGRRISRSQDGAPDVRPAEKAGMNM